MSGETTRDVGFDLDAYAAEYTGHTAVNRLVAAHNSDLLSPNLRSRAIFVAISIVKSETRDVELYAQLLSSITVPVDAQAYDGVSGITTEQDGTSDGAWVEETEEAVQKEETKLHAEMRNYSTNLIKESIRLTLHTQAAHLRLCGQWDAAILCYTKTRDYNSSPQNEIDSCLGILEVSIIAGKWGNIMSAVVKAEYAVNRLMSSASAANGSGSRGGQGHGPSGGESIRIMTAAEARERGRQAVELDELAAKIGAKLAIARGLTLMNQGKASWAQAAREFAKVPSTAKDGLFDWEGKILSSSDVVIYATLTGLAALDRGAIISLLVEDSAMRSLIDRGGATYTRDLVDSYRHARYKRLFELLVEHRLRHQVDPTLRRTISAFEECIWENTLVQYFQPFSSADFARMMEAFGPDLGKTLATSVDKVSWLIEEGRLEARLDLVDMAVQAVRHDPRREVYKDALTNGQKVEAATHRSLLRMQMIEHGLTLEANTKGGDGPGKRTQPRRRPQGAG